MLNNFQPGDLVRRVKELRQPRLGPDGMPAVDQPWYKTPVPVVAAAGVATLVIGGLIAGPKVVEAVGPSKEAEVVAAEVPAGPPPAPIEGTVEAAAPDAGDVDVSDLVSGRDARPAAAASPGLRQVGAPIGNAPAPPAPEPEPEAPAPEGPPPAPEPTVEDAPAQPEPLPTPTGNWNLSRETPAAPPVEPAPPVDTRPDPAPEPAPEPTPDAPEPAPPAAPAPPVDTRPDPAPEPAPEPTPDAPEPAPDSPEPPAPPAPETPKPEPSSENPTPSATATPTATVTTKPAPSTTATPEPPKDGPVTYRVDGTGKAKVTYLGVGGNPVTETVSLPWSKTIPKGVDPAKAKITAEDEDGKELDGAVEFKSTTPARPSEKPEEKREWIPSDRAGDDRGAKGEGAPPKPKEAEKPTTPKDDGENSYGTS